MSSDENEVAPYARLISRVLPLLSQNMTLGNFAAQLINFGLKQTDENKSSAFSLKAETTWRGYANGTSGIPPKFATNLLGRWDSELFITNIQSFYEEDVLNDLADCLKGFRKDINKFNVTIIFAEIVHDTLFAIANNRDVNEVFEESRIKATQADISKPLSSSNMISVQELPNQVNKPERAPVNLQPSEELYVRQLIAAYLNSAMPNLADISLIPSEFTSHFNLQRDCFYLAEWARESTWASIKDGEVAYNAFLDELFAVIYNAVVFKQLPMERLSEALDKASSMSLDGIMLSAIVDLISPKVKMGGCHQLVNDERIAWSDK